MQFTQQEIKAWSRIIAPFVALIVAVVIGLWVGPSIQVRPLPQPSPLNFSFAAASTQTVRWQAPKWNADLFRMEQPLTAAPETTGLKIEDNQPVTVTELHLQFIIFTDDKKICKINEQFFEEGQMGKGFVVKNITRTGVLLEPVVPSDPSIASGQSYFVYLGQKINVTFPISVGVH